MPKKPVDYSKAVIYKIVCKDPEIDTRYCYVGSTTSLKHRKKNHKTNCNNENSRKYNYYVYQFMRENGGPNNFSFIELEKYPCNDKYELEKREREWIELLKPILNKCIPTRTNQEYQEKNKEYYNQKKKNYKEKHKEYLNEKIECECGEYVVRGNLSRHKKTKKHLNKIENY
jgi:hypothetical protein